MLHFLTRPSRNLRLTRRTHLAIFTIAIAATAHAADFIVSPSGSASGNGSTAAPWNLVTALKQPAAVRPGDTLLLRGGTYTAPDRLVVHSFLTGAAGRYITVRPWPGERAIIDGGIQVHGPWVIFRDLEIMNSRTNRVTSQAGSFPTDVPQPAGIETIAPNVKVINNVIHDASTGISSWREASENEFYGNIVYYNGWKGPDRGHGHGAYMQNQFGKKYLTDNIFFSQFELGLQLYGTSSTYLNNFELEGNVVFNSGELAGAFTRNILIGGTVIANNPVLRNNYTYFTTSWNHGGDNNIGYYLSGYGCTNLKLENNYFVSGGIALTLHRCSISSLTGNTFFGENRNWNPAAYGGNTVLDRNRPSAPAVFVRPNRYETGRAHIVVFNWPRSATVPVNLGGIGLASGDTFEIRDVQNFFGPAVCQGVYSGAPVSLPMTSTAIARPVGNVPVVPAHTDMEFGTFVVLRKSTATPAPAPAPQPAPNPALSITGAASNSVTSTSATITWTTSNPATQDLEYGTTTALGLRAGTSSTLTTSHSVNLTGLTAGRTYYTRIVSRDGYGQTAESRTVQFNTPASAPPPSPSPAPAPAPPASAFSSFTEAENASRYSFPIVADEATSGRKFVTAAVAETAYITYNVYVPTAGVYTFWFRALARDAQTSSLYVSVDGGQEDIFDIAYGAWSPNWQWVRLNGRSGQSPLTLNPRTFALTAGWHKLTIRARQAGTSVDGFVVTNDLSLTPTDTTFGAIAK